MSLPLLRILALLLTSRVFIPSLVTLLLVTLPVQATNAFHAWNEVHKQATQAAFQETAKVLNPQCLTCTNIVWNVMQPTALLYDGASPLTTVTDRTVLPTTGFIARILGTRILSFEYDGHPAVVEITREWERSFQSLPPVAPNSIANPVPSTLARVIPEGVPATTLGRPGAADVFVTAADDIAGMNAAQISQRLTIPQSPTAYRVIEFATPESGIASPVFRSDPGFIGGGRTAGGAREFVIPNQPIAPGATIRRVP
jgi:hypothetical protein